MMIKKDFLKAIAEKTSMSKAVAELFLDATIDVLKTVFKNQDSITLHGFGTFEGKQRKAYKGRNPNTGEIIDVPEMRVATFRQSAALKSEINQGNSMQEEKTAETV